MNKKFTAKTWKQGKSTVITIPKKTLQENNIETKDTLEITINAILKAIYIQKPEQTQNEEQKNEQTQYTRDTDNNS